MAGRARTKALTASAPVLMGPLQVSRDTSPDGCDVLFVVYTDDEMAVSITTLGGFASEAYRWEIAAKDYARSLTMANAGRGTH
jgi:hypothetical protein